IGPFWFPDMFASLGYAGSGGLCAGIVFIAAWLPTAFIQFRGGALRARRNASVSNA
ncbi:hypothetical protein MMC08_005519, partial [Hypocenomyce scalaris]|nr:hypothetical protein [Hypocenomyce scalaris]